MCHCDSRSSLTAGGGWRDGVGAGGDRVLLGVRGRRGASPAVVPASAGAGIVVAAHTTRSAGLAYFP